MWYAKIGIHAKVLVVLVCASGLGLAQDRGTIRGVVTDPSGAAVPDAVVTAKNVNTGLIQVAATGADGVYNMPYLPVGVYNVTTEKPGFRTATVSNIRLDVNTVVDVNTAMTVGAIDQKVEVSAHALMLEVQGTNLGKTLDGKAIMDLPLFLTGGLRSTMNFIILTPGVIGSTGNPRIAAGLENGQSEQMDGAEAQSERRNDAALSGISVEAVEEFKVQSGAYSAEYGRSSNGVINWVTKSGTNDLHGSGFLFARNEFFNARGFTFTATERPVVRQWNPGGSIGGPIDIPKVFNGRNKAFFFFAFERAQTRNGRATSLVTVPIPDFRNGDFRKLVDSRGNQIPLYDPFDAAGNLIADPTQRARLQCNGVLNVICPNRIDPRAKAVESILPQPDNPNLITNNTRSYARSTSLSWVPSWKGDYIFSEKQRASFMYGYQTTPAQPCISSIQNVPCSTWPTTSKIQYYRLNYDYVIRPSLLNHFTIGFNRRNYIENPDNINNVDDAWRQAVQIPGTVVGGKPGKATEYDTQYVSYATRVDTDSRSRTTNLKEQLTWIKGRHSVKFGIDYLRSVYRRLDCVGCAGQLGFSNVATSNPSVPGQSGAADASFLLGLVSQGQFSYGADAAYHWPYYAWYVQDDFKVSKKLTVNIGLRYDLIIPKEERHHYNSNLCLTCPNPDAGGLPGTMIVAGRNGAPDRFGDTRLNGLGPRLGIAYQLDSKTVIRAGGAIYYQPTREDRNADDGIQGFGGWFYAPSDYLALGVAMNLKDGFTIFPQQIQANKPPAPDANSIQLYGTPSFYSGQAGRAPYFTDFNFTIERGIGNSSVFRVSYHGNVGNKLLSRKQTLNQLDPKYLPIYGSLLGQSLSTLLNNPAAAAQLAAHGFQLPYAGYPLNFTLSQALRPFPQYQNIDGSGGGLNDGHLTFHALESSFEHRFSSGLYMIASYTFCKTLSTVDSEYQYAGFGPAQNQYNRSLDKSVSFEDTPHNLRVSYVYELPFGKGKKWLGAAHPALNMIAGNWRVSAIHTYVSGRPLIFRASQQMYGATGVEPVTDGSVIAGALSTRASIYSGVPLINPNWGSGKSMAFGVPELNTAAFFQPPSMQYGNLPPTVPWLRQPWTINEDIAILKNFNITEKRYVELRAGGSNALNRALLAAPDVNVNSPTFGKITQPQGNSPRSIQLGLKFYF